MSDTQGFTIMKELSSNELKKALDKFQQVLRFYIRNVQFTKVNGFWRGDNKMMAIANVCDSISTMHLLNRKYKIQLNIILIHNWR